MKTISCKDVGVQGCDWKATGQTDDELLKKAAEHAKLAHGMTQIPEDMKKKVLSSIREIKAA